MVKYFNRRERYFGAVKFLFPKNKGQIDDMMKEVTRMQELSKLNCPFLIKLRNFQYLSKENKFAIDMEYCICTLKDILNEKKTN